MPLYEGRPNQPCPRKAQGSLSQGDLILCKECEEYHFSYMKIVQPDKSKESVISTRTVTRTRSHRNQNSREPVPGKNNNSGNNRTHGMSASAVSEDSDISTDLCIRCHEPAVQNKTRLLVISVISIFMVCALEYLWKSTPS